MTQRPSEGRMFCVNLSTSNWGEDSNMFLLSSVKIPSLDFYSPIQLLSIKGKKASALSVDLSQGPQCGSVPGPSVWSVPGPSVWPVPGSCSCISDPTALSIQLYCGSWYDPEPTSTALGGGMRNTTKESWPGPCVQRKRVILN